MAVRLVLLAVVLGAAGCRPDASPPAAASKAVPVQTARVVGEDVDVVVQAVGTLAAQQVVKVSPKRSGRLVQLLAAEGQQVTAGTVIARLDDRDLRARLDQARAAVTEADASWRQASREHARMNELRARGIVAQQEHDQVQAALERAAAARDVGRANVALAEAELADTVVAAPFGGVLGRRLVDPGAYVQEGEAVTTLVDADPVEIVFTVPERHLASLRAGQPVSVTVASQPDRPIDGTVSFVDPEVDPVNRTVTVKAVLPNPSLTLRPGQFATASLTLARHAGAPIVPEEAIITQGDQAMVYVVADGTAVARPIRVGVRLPGRAEVTDGVRVGDVVVRTGHEKLRVGQAMPVRETQAAEG